VKKFPCLRLEGSEAGKLVVRKYQLISKLFSLPASKPPAFRPI